MSEKKSKTNHQTDYHKPVKNPTTNYRMDSHKFFCKRCLKHNEGCIINGKKKPAASCNI